MNTLKSCLLALVLLLGGAGQAALADACEPTTPPASVWGANPIVTYLLVAIAPDKLAGWNFPPPQQARGIFPDTLFNRPVIGGWFGQGKTPNVESLAALHPDLTLVSGATVGSERSLELLKRLGLASCEVSIDRVQDYPAALRKVGVAVGAAERGEALARMAEELLAAMQRIPKADAAAPSVFYAQGPDGLATECAGSLHAEVIPLAGGRNVFTCAGNAGENRFGMLRIDFEQLARLDPDFILTQEAGFAHRAKLDARWQGLRAVREGRILLMPQEPFRWMDRPPSFMRLLAVHWLAERLHPGADLLDLRQTTRAFFNLYFNHALNDAALTRILQAE